MKKQIENDKWQDRKIILLWWEDCQSIQSDQKCYVEEFVKFCQVYVEIEWCVEYDFVNWERFNSELI
jgi:hypothetical protein